MLSSFWDKLPRLLEEAGGDPTIANALRISLAAHFNSAKHEALVLADGTAKAAVKAFHKHFIGEN